MVQYNSLHIKQRREVHRRHHSPKSKGGVFLNKLMSVCGKADELILQQEKCKLLVEKRKRKETIDDRELGNY